MGRCVVDATGLAGWIGSSGAQVAIAAWAALGVAALMYSIACCDPDASKKVAPPRLGVWFLTWAAVTFMVGDLGRPAIAWTVAGQLLVGCSVPVAAVLPTLVARRPGAVLAAVAVVLWGVTGALGYGIVTQAAAGGDLDGCAERRRALWWLTGVAAATSTASLLVATAAGKRE